MAYKFTDRLKEWTSYVGVAAAGLATMVPMVVPADNHWVQIWQAAQLFVGGAMIFIPQTAGTTAVENDSWTLLKAFAQKLPPQYAGPMQPLLSTLASHLANAEAGGQPLPVVLPQHSIVAPMPPVAPAQPPTRVFATPVPPPGAPVPPPSAPAPVVPPVQQVAPLVADPAEALKRVS